VDPVLDEVPVLVPLVAPQVAELQLSLRQSGVLRSPPRLLEELSKLFPLDHPVVPVTARLLLATWYVVMIFLLLGLIANL